MQYMDSLINIHKIGMLLLLSGILGLTVLIESILFLENAPMYLHIVIVISTLAVLAISKLTLSLGFLREQASRV